MLATSATGYAPGMLATSATGYAPEMLATSATGYAPEMLATSATGYANGMLATSACKSNGLRYSWRAGAPRSIGRGPAKAALYGRYMVLRHRDLGAFRLAGPFLRKRATRWRKRQGDESGKPFGRFRVYDAQFLSRHTNKLESMAQEAPLHSVNYVLFSHLSEKSDDRQVARRQPSGLSNSQKGGEKEEFFL
jgi:hypothetical protein